jgi:hypothetical protein
MSRALDLFNRLVAGGEAEILSFFAQPVTEELLLDYKRTADNGCERFAFEGSTKPCKGNIWFWQF